MYAVPNGSRNNNTYFLRMPRATQLWAHLNIIPPTPCSTLPNIGSSQYSNPNHIDNSQWLYRLIHMPLKSTLHRMTTTMFLSFAIWHIWNIRNKNTLDRKTVDINISMILNTVAEYYFLKQNNNTKNLTIPLYIK